MLNVRLDKDQEKKLKEFSNSKNISKTEMVKEALAMYYKSQSQKTSPYDSGKELFGVYGSGESDRSRTYKSKIKDHLHEKHSH